MSLVTPIFELPKRRSTGRVDTLAYPRPHSAEIIILPCIRREPLGADARLRITESA